MKKIIWKLSSPYDLKNKISLSESWIDSVNNGRQELKDIITWKSNKKMLIIGPCSADYEESLYEYAWFLNEIQKKVEDKIKIVMRFYTGKPRTIWGWKWLQNSNPWEIPNLISWIENSRKIAIHIIEKYNLPLADELLHPQLIEHIEDIYSYFAIWARSSENQFHREVSSGLSFPVWLKNPTSGDIKLMLNSIQASLSPSVYAIWDSVYETTWNNYSHWILRWWKNWPNYSFDFIKNTFDLMNEKNIKNKALIIDTNHDNSRKQYENQNKIMEEVICIIRENEELKNFVKWFMVESYLYDGRQDFPCHSSEPIPFRVLHGDIKKWLSLTDPCIWREKTEELIMNLYNLI